MVQFSMSLVSSTLRADSAVKNRPLFAPKMSREALLRGLRRSLTVADKELSIKRTKVKNVR